MAPIPTRKTSLVVIAIMATALGAIVTPAVSAASGPVGIWHLEGNLENARDTNVKLRKLGDPIFVELLVHGKAKKALRFDEGEGLKIKRIPKAGRRTYTIDTLVEYDAVDGFRRIINFGPNNVDRGLYFHNGKVNLYPVNESANSVVLPNTWAQLRVTRNGSTGKMKVYINGVQKLKFTDKKARYTLRRGQMVLFRDDPLNEEHPSGTVSTIKLWRRVVAP